MTYFYLVKLEEVVYDHIKYSMISLGVSDSPTRQEIIDYRNRLRCLIDTGTSINYLLIEMGLDFSTPYVGLKAYTIQEIKIEMALSKWFHNI